MPPLQTSLTKHEQSFFGICQGQNKRTGGEFMTKGPLAGIQIIEMAGIGPGPFACMLLADLGAEVVRITRPGAQDPLNQDVLLRGRINLPLNLKSDEGLAVCRKLISSADGLVEGFRPGVMERLGLGPDRCLEDNAKLVYGRMTGWGQDGPLAQAAGHDINYIALSGALAAMGTADSPSIPLNLVGDFGGGALYLAMGLCAGLLHAAKTGEGQVVDAAMTDGAASLMAMFYGLYGRGEWSLQRGQNMLDGGHPYYAVYKTKDEKFVAIGAIEKNFYDELIMRLGLDPRDFDRGEAGLSKEAQKRAFEDVFSRKTQAEWCAILEGSDACFAPVLDMSEAPYHPQNQHRQSFVKHEGAWHPNVAPKFGTTPGEVGVERRKPTDLLRAIGLEDKEISIIFKE